MVSGQWIWGILHRQLFRNGCTSLMLAVVVLEVLAPYRRTVLPLVLKIVTLMLAKRQLFLVSYVPQFLECYSCFADPCFYVCLGF
ncbi:unnamed protein product [Schistosoma curassoni]|uniref:Secreted protein n=1 Tax=Schistosoma curassoni TaxID=6186 RepID=A0A183K4L1_9TREM|nr:unnamed protein product [Schistosoma curassoni]